jgi:hypothetical protein
MSLVTPPLEQILTTRLPPHWQVRQVVVLDWSDGPREGFCELVEPPCCFAFKIFAEPLHELDEQALFTLRQLERDAVQHLLVALNELGPPRSPVWVPMWKFRDRTAQVRAEEYINRLYTTARQTPLVISTSDMVHFSSCWVRTS